MAPNSGFGPFAINLKAKTKSVFSNCCVEVAVLIITSLAVHLFPHLAIIKNIKPLFLVSSLAGADKARENAGAIDRVFNVAN